MKRATRSTTNSSRSWKDLGRVPLGEVATPPHQELVQAFHDVPNCQHQPPPGGVGSDALFGSLHSTRRGPSGTKPSALTGERLHPTMLQPEKIETRYRLSQVHDIRLGIRQR